MNSGSPKHPTSTPIKRTALGRLKHEGAETVLNRDGRVVVYMSDDEQFQFLYRYVSDDRFDPEAPEPGEGVPLWAWIGGGAGVAATGVGVGLRMMAVSTQSEFVERQGAAARR